MATKSLTPPLREAEGIINERLYSYLASPCYILFNDVGRGVVARIVKVNGLDNHDKWANVEVVMDDGEICQVWVGGDCEIYFDKGQIKAWVKRPTNKVLDKSSTKD